MREIPILFSAPMVRAILAGGKSQTRRLCKDLNRWLVQDCREVRFHGGQWCHFMKGAAEPTYRLGRRELRFMAGDHLWVKETLTARPLTNFLTGEPTKAIVAAYAADDEDVVEQAGFNLAPWWRGGEDRRASLPSIFMPRHASRITLEVTDVRVERLQDISEADALAEGIEACDGMLDEVELCMFAKEMGIPATEARVWYRSLWETINGAGSWQANPWVTVLTFRRLSAADAPARGPAHE